MTGRTGTGQSARIERRAAYRQRRSTLDGRTCLAARLHGKGADARAPQESPVADIDVVGSRDACVGTGRHPHATPPLSLPRVAGACASSEADFRPQYVLALDGVSDARGSRGLVPGQRPGRPNGRTGWVRADAVELRPVATAGRLPRRAQVRAVGRQQLVVPARSRSAGPGRRRPRALLRHLAFSPSTTRSPRRLRVRDERVLEAHRLAGRRHGRHPRDLPAASCSDRPSRTAACACRTRRRLPPPRVPVGTPIKTSASEIVRLDARGDESSRRRPLSRSRDVVRRTRACGRESIGEMR